MRDARPSPYHGARMTLVTLHGKEDAIAPALRDALTVTLEVTRDIDTDALGTFTREIPRVGTQREAAFRKAFIASERSPAGLGLGSEGAFVPGPLGLGCWNVELLAFVDRGANRCIIGRARAPGLHLYGTVDSLDELETFATRAEFPHYGLTLRPAESGDPRIRKGLRSWSALQAAFAECRMEAGDGKVWVEHDLRAHMHPGRMIVVGLAAQDLARRLLTPCPRCQLPGYGPERSIAGLPCLWCGTQTSAVRGTAWSCASCTHEEEVPVTASTKADPGDCPRCNP
ncbi:MAG: DUF6671 family protein [Candidatus Sericytochromatia bacterium]|nr:DUF6671 family protein [Candidatus Sericytochromatia bacterium]